MPKPADEQMTLLTGLREQIDAAITQRASLIAAKDALNLQRQEIMALSQRLGIAANREVVEKEMQMLQEHIEAMILQTQGLLRKS